LGNARDIRLTRGDLIDGNTNYMDLVPAATRPLHIGTNGAKPAAGANYRGCIYMEEGGGGVRDRFYICLKSDAAVYNWVEIANGGA